MLASRRAHHSSLRKLEPRLPLHALSRNSLIETDNLVKPEALAAAIIKGLQELGKGGERRQFNIDDAIAKAKHAWTFVGSLATAAEVMQVSVEEYETNLDITALNYFLTTLGSGIHPLLTSTIK